MKWLFCQVERHRLIWYDVMWCDETYDVRYSEVGSEESWIEVMWYDMMWAELRVK